MIDSTFGLHRYYGLEDAYFWIKVQRDMVIRLASPLLNNLARSRKLKILDAGCGKGGLLALLSYRGEVMGVDASEEAVNFCREKYNFKVQPALIQDLPFVDSAFDFIFCVDVIEHLEDDLKAMRELYRVLKPGGFLITTIPAFMSLWGYHDQEQGHFRRYTKATFFQLSTQAGFKIGRFYYFKSLLFLPLYFMRKFKKAISLNSDDFYRPTPIINQLLCALLSIDNIIATIVNLPIGTSLIAVLSKQNKYREVTGV